MKIYDEIPRKFWFKVGKGEGLQWTWSYTLTNRACCYLNTHIPAVSMLNNYCLYVSNL